MTSSIKILYVVVVLSSAVYGRTLRYQIVTRDDGSKEIINSQSGATPSPDLKFLAQDLNITWDRMDDLGPDEENGNEAEEEKTTKETPTEDLKQAHQLINKWNTYTANGWTGQTNAVYANSTKLVIYDDGEKKNLTNHHTKQGRSENFTNEADTIEVPIDQPGLWEVIERLYNCFQDFAKHGSTLNCLKSRATSLFLKYVDQSFVPTGGKSVEQKTLHHGKKVLKGALLPLLVLLVIKYLVALPVIAAGLITIKTFWLSLLSAGVAAFGAPWKTHVIKKYRPDQEQAWSQPPPWTTNLHHAHEASGKIGFLENLGTEKYFM